MRQGARGRIIMTARGSYFVWRCIDLVRGLTPYWAALRYSRVTGFLYCLQITLKLTPSRPLRLTPSDCMGSLAWNTDEGRISRGILSTITT